MLTSGNGSLTTRACLLLASTLALSACGGRSTDNVTLDPDHIRFIQHQETKLCFAYVGSAPSYAIIETKADMSLTHVPCTDEVLALIRRDR
jgi:hypothetical protein